MTIRIFKFSTRLEISTYWYNDNRMSTEHKLHTILFCSPRDFAKNKTGLRLTIDNRMYREILKKPKIYSDKHGIAYIFGKKYPIDKYRELGSHIGKGSTGIVDLDLLVNDSKLESVVRRLYKPSYNWSDRNAFKQLHIYAPYVLFVGKTLDNGTGSPAIFAHYRYGKIDSILIDDFYFYE